MTTELYKANHLYLMKIALIEKTSREIKPLQLHVLKKTHQTKTKEIVPIFAARQRSISEYFTSSDKYTTQTEKTKMIKTAKRIPSNHTQAINPIKSKRNQGRSFRKVSDYVTKKTTNAQDLTSFSNTKQQQKTF
jgi:hypothetical protein